MDAGITSSRVTRVAPLLRDRSGLQRVTNIELFFDLVYVFAITQLSHHLLGDPTVRGALQAGLLLVMVWLVWAYTTRVTNWLDPERIALESSLTQQARKGGCEMLRNPHGIHRSAPRLDVTARARTPGRVVAPTSSAGSSQPARRHLRAGRRDGAAPRR